MHSKDQANLRPDGHGGLAECLILAEAGQWAEAQGSYEVARRLRSHQETQDMYLVTLTGRGGVRDRRRAREAGFDEHVTKPMSSDGLLKILTASSVKSAA